MKPTFHGLEITPDLAGLILTYYLYNADLDDVGTGWRELKADLLDKGLLEKAQDSYLCANDDDSVYAELDSLSIDDDDIIYQDELLFSPTAQIIENSGITAKKLIGIFEDGSIPETDEFVLSLIKEIQYYGN